ncbi:hypothetical protein LZ554_004417 [Drepanopeziza brunnea f. sp. 'monogermtubi']|nr:hypothetical protein LZ554_004417 [Drepanopeziza brunnea f. sp. 'monogermtubi']
MSPAVADCCLIRAAGHACGWTGFAIKMLLLTQGKRVDCDAGDSPIGSESVQIQQATCMDSSVSNHGPPGIGFGSKERDALLRGRRRKWKWKWE